MCDHMNKETQVFEVIDACQRSIGLENHRIFVWTLRKSLEHMVIITPILSWYLDAVATAGRHSLGKSSLAAALDHIPTKS